MFFDSAGDTSGGPCVGITIYSPEDEYTTSSGEGKVSNEMTREKQKRKLYRTTSQEMTFEHSLGGINTFRSKN